MTIYDAIPMMCHKGVSLDMTVIWKLYLKGYDASLKIIFNMVTYMTNLNHIFPINK